MKEIKFNLFPGGKRRALTLSYDDGRAADYRLVEIMNKYGIKGTFHLNSSRFDNGDYVSAKDVKTLYANHEISVHTSHHPDLTKLPMSSMVSEILSDKAKLEEICGYPVRGMSFPFGTYNDDVLTSMKACDMEYSRTTQATNNFKIPNNFLTWHPTCHHSHNVFEKVESFDNLRPWTGMSLFYVWGHSYEFDNNNNWELIEEFCKTMSDKQDLWFATNIEILDYIKTIQNLKFSADKSMVYNPSVISAWILADNEPVKINPGQNNI